MARMAVGVLALTSGSGPGFSFLQPWRREFDGGDRPLPMVASDRDSQAVDFIKPDSLHRTGLSVGEDRGLADKLSLGLLKLAEDRGRTDLRSWHG